MFWTILKKIRNESERCHEKQKNESYDSLRKPKSLMWGQKLGFYKANN